MDLQSQRGAISESAVAHDLLKLGYEVFINTTGKSLFDMVAHKDGKLLRIQVKSCWQRDESGMYSVQLKSVRPNSRGNKIKKFDPNSCDLLAVYLQGSGICYLNPKEVGTRTVINLRMFKTNGVNKDKKQWIIEDFRKID